MTIRTDIEQALRLISGGHPFEIRAPEVTNGRGFTQPHYGYFDNAEKAADAVVKLDKLNTKGIFITLNPVHPDLLARAYNRIKPGGRGDPTTTDEQITARRWLLIDVDPTRPAGVSSSDDEHANAIGIADAIRAHLADMGWPDPVRADSGNGAHLLYRVDLPNDPEARDLIHRCLQALAAEFDCPGMATVDQGVFNASRISKAYGTMTRKGDSIPTRPHRRSRTISSPDEPEVVPDFLLHILADQAPKPEPQERARPTTTTGGTDLEARARKYMETVPPPQDGSASNDLYRAACKLVNDFDLGDAMAADILRDWSYAYDPALPEREISRAITHAKKHAKGDRGRLANEPREHDRQADRRQRDETPAKERRKNTPATTPGSAEEARETYNRAKDTDMGNAERLVAKCADSLRYVTEWGWLGWDGKRWAIDDGKAREAYKRSVVQAIYDEVAVAAQARDMDMVRTLSKWARRSEDGSRISGALATARTDPRFYVKHTIFDSDPWLFTVENGTIDLRTGKLRPHNPDDLCTKRTGIPFDPAATCPIWERFLGQIFAGNEELVGFVQRAVGYSLTGSTEEQVLFLMHGKGRNGKSVMIETIARILGDYGVETPAETLMARRNETNNSNDLARLAGARMVTANETEDGQRLAESKVKAMTGGDTITARFLHKEFFQFRPQFKLWIRTNHRPQIRGSDEGIWRRMRLIPFEVQIPEEEQDKRLPMKLAKELPGILAWAVRGCLAWQADGLKAPTAVTKAVADYRSDQDVVGSFLRERCIVRGHGYGSATAKEIYKEYTDWCEEAGERPMSQRRLSQSLAERGLAKRRGSGGVWTWDGITIGQMAGGEYEQPYGGEPETELKPGESSEPVTQVTLVTRKSVFSSHVKNQIFENTRNNVTNVTNVTLENCENDDSSKMKDEAVT